MKIGNHVLYRPFYIGYGYEYGVDAGIPALVTRVHASGRITSVFNRKDGVPVRPVVVSPGVCELVMEGENGKTNAADRDVVAHAWSSGVARDGGAG